MLTKPWHKIPFIDALIVSALAVNVARYCGWCSGLKSCKAPDESVKPEEFSDDINDYFRLRHIVSLEDSPFAPCIAMLKMLEATKYSITGFSHPYCL